MLAGVTKWWCLLLAPIIRAIEDHYEVLGVDRDATTAQIKRAHRKLVLQYHPDKIDPSADQEAANAKFIAIQEAYEVLSDDERRTKYDTLGEWAQFGDFEEAPDGGRGSIMSKMSQLQTRARDIGKMVRFSFFLF